MTKKYILPHFLILFLFLISTSILAQSPIEEKKVDKPHLGLLDIAPQPHKGRIIGLTAWSLGSYTATMISLNNVWYSQYERSKFHFFNDNSEWLQMDKVGHAWTSYSEGLYGVALFRWAGLKDKKAIWIGGMVGTFFQAGIEVLDGFSARWGASVGDLVANSTGSALVIFQELAWQEQRFRLKYSAHRPDYKDFDTPLQLRAEDLYGTTIAEQLLKDYNGQTYWLTVNPSTFIKNPDSKFPKWLSIAVGYGGDGIFGGHFNQWTDDGGVYHDYENSIPRTRQYYLSVDVDLDRIPTNSKLLKVILGAVNVLKFPAPALEFGKEGTKFHAIYY
ncbi:MAG: DUF2279 domain-containing protein [Chitinophagales bacterium]